MKRSLLFSLLSLIAISSCISNKTEAFLSFGNSEFTLKPYGKAIGQIYKHVKPLAQLGTGTLFAGLAAYSTFCFRELWVNNPNTVITFLPNEARNPLMNVFGALTVSAAAASTFFFINGISNIQEIADENK